MIDSQSRSDKPRLLVADDEPEIAGLVEAIAEELGFAVHCVHAGEKVVSQVEALDPSVIVLDLRMPGADGVEVLRALAQQKSKARIVLMSGMDQRTITSVQTLGRDQNLDIVGTLMKPMSLDDIEAVLSPLLKGGNSAPAIHHTATYALGSDFGLQTLYEPEVQLNLETGKNVHRVALSAQWKLDNGEILSGNKFLHWADQQGVSKGITDQLLNEALQHWHGWVSQGLSPELIIRIGSSMLHDLKTTEVLTSIVEQHNVPKEKIVIETTEASVLDSIDNAIDVLSRLRIKGFKIAISIESDSESVLSMVDKLPMDEIVIDMYPLLSKNNFREDMEVEFTYSSLTSMTRQKDIVCTARNIVREDLLAFVIQCKFQGARGSVISEPISAKAVEPFFRAES